MRRFHIESFINVLQLSPARRQKAIQRSWAQLAPFPPEIQELLLPLMAAALKAQHDALALMETARTARELTMHATGARETDIKLDRLLTTLRDALETIAATFGTQEAELAQKLLADLLPDGVTYFTNKPFIEQHAALGLLVERLREQATWDALVKLQLTLWVERLEALNATYGEQITKPEPAPREKIKAANLRGYVAMTQVVAVILGLYSTNSESDIEARTKLLGPIVEQEEEAALLRARRRNGTPDGQPPDSEEEDEGEEEEVVPVATK